jgi:hypothetical protein
MRCRPLGIERGAATSLADLATSVTGAAHSRDGAANDVT